MTPARTTASVVCMVAAVGAAAGAVIARRAQGAAATVAEQKNQAEVSGMLDATQKTLEGLERGLEIEVARLTAEDDRSVLAARGAEQSRTITFDSDSLTVMIRIDVNRDAHRRRTAGRARRAPRPSLPRRAHAARRG